jgi:hypothetical protein
MEASKYLGVTITNDLSWDRHIDNVAAKGNRTLGFIRRNLRECTKQVRETSYLTMMVSDLNQGRQYYLRMVFASVHNNLNLIIFLAVHL